MLIPEPITGKEDQVHTGMGYPPHEKPGNRGGMETRWILGVLLLKKRGNSGKVDQQEQHPRLHPLAGCSSPLWVLSHSSHV